MLPYLTADLKGCGGILKSQSEDFLVEEIPSYLPQGEGEHIYLWIEKRNLTTHQLIKRIGDHLGVDKIQFGYAGLKDAQAVTRQWVSIHHPTPLNVESLQSDTFTILQASRHGNKLRRGHLKGNRFTILVRKTEPSFDHQLYMNVIESQGIPNYFGSQRFGANGDNHLRGKTLLTRASLKKRHSEQERFLINAYQSHLFNTLVARRLKETGTLKRIYPGDLAFLHAKGACFAVTDAELGPIQIRCDSGELSPSAPLFGWKTPLAEGIPGDWERSLLSSEGLSLDSFRFGSKKDSPAGERRPMRIFPQELSMEPQTLPDGAGLRLSFTLPAGCYATTLLRELMKTDTPAGQEAPMEEGRHE